MNVSTKQWVSMLVDMVNEQLGCQVAQTVQEEPAKIVETGEVSADITEIMKKVVSERDMIDLKKNGCLSVRIGAYSLLTDLAKEYAAKNKITITRCSQDE